MELVWIPISVLGALMQAVRTAAQRGLNARLSTMVTTYVRSLFGLPVLLAYLAAVVLLGGEQLPGTGWRFFAAAAAAATAQLAATALLIHLFSLRSFAVGTMLSKTDVMMTAIVGSLLFSESIDGLGWLAIALTVAGVLLISLGRLGIAGAGGQRPATMRVRAVSWPTGIGLLTGFFFCLSYLFLREASLSLGGGGFLIRGAVTVVAVTAIQVLALGLWLLFAERAGLRAMWGEWRAGSFIGLTSAIGSICWFTAMTIENASYVRAVGQVEAVFTLAISWFYFREWISAPELAGVGVIVLGVICFLA